MHDYDKINPSPFRTLFVKLASRLDSTLVPIISTKITKNSVRCFIWYATLSLYYISLGALTMVIFRCGNRTPTSRALVFPITGLSQTWLKDILRVLERSTIAKLGRPRKKRNTVHIPPRWMMPATRTMARLTQKKRNRPIFPLLPTQALARLHQENDPTPTQARQRKKASRLQKKYDYQIPITVGKN